MNYKQDKKTIINRLITIKFKICTLLGRRDCGGVTSKNRAYEEWLVMEDSSTQPNRLPSALVWFGTNLKRFK